MTTLRNFAAASVLIFAAATAQAADFKITTDSAPNGQFPLAQIANQFGCQGGNVSPHLTWSGAPAGTKSFVVTMYDQDAPTGSGFWHWAVANIPADVTDLPAGAGSAGGTLPSGAHTVTNDAGIAGYLGACPPGPEAHRYLITVNALKVDKLDLPANASPAFLGFMVATHSIGKATIVVRGKRP
ncbi:YbhB/YbcL family Raf kinase inhibitor-like protein [Methylovirgula sp. 4M-Z18]|uniref:YbhB/YbcL family Raf kinase inhibitor-like protein n=1 Tax=Methylovirgula sp. 4M-Z18 TaxID=2293567 RepID=UPI000E2F7C98|nr:YbhB/YbcL family Raf kinase inhibitor-like protein [Methylovirgula sp. 4M-Z18]RFB79077.1 YbhB/YbcL family Raf kinase inhibitor-like protein [Methylovirgula sp. 4M-Z18]